MNTYISPLAVEFMKKHARDLVVILTVKDDMYRLTPYHDYVINLSELEEFIPVYSEAGLFRIVTLISLKSELKDLRLGVLHDGKNMVIVGRGARPTIIDRRWESKLLHP